MLSYVPSEMTDQEDEIRRIPKRSFIFEKKSNFREVLYIEIHDSVRRKELLQRNLPEKWKINSPEAIISITGVDHQFNIRDKCNLKRDLIEAVINTGSWIVTCGTESKVVQFIEDAVNEHITLQDCHIPIVGILSQSVHEEIIPEYTKSVELMKGNETKWVQIPTKSTKDVLDPNHTQFIFTKDFKRKQTGSTATSECRAAFEHFLSNISIKDTGTMSNTNNVEINTRYDENEIQEILPVILVLIEGGMDALKTAVCVLESENPVVVIDGSGGAADFLATSYERDISNDETAKPDETLSKLIKKCFEDDSILLLEEVKKLPLHLFAKHELIYIYSLEDKTAKVDEYIQNAIFDVYKEFYAKKLENLKNDSAKRKHSEIVIKKQLKLIKKWKRCDIAWKDIFIAENRNGLSDLQTTVSTPVMNKLKEKMDTYLKMQVRGKLKWKLENLDILYKGSRVNTDTFNKLNEFKLKLKEDLEKFDSLVENIDKCISQFEIAEPSVVKSFTTSVRGIKEWLEITLTEHDDQKSMNNVRINSKFTEDLEHFETLVDNMEKCISEFDDVKPSDVKSFSKSVKTIKECIEKKPTETDHQKVYEEEVKAMKERINDFLHPPVNIQVMKKFKERMEQFLKNPVIRTFTDTHPDAKSHLLKKIGEWKSEEVKPSYVKSLTKTLHEFKRCLQFKGDHEEDVVTEFWKVIDNFLHFQMSDTTQNMIDLHKAMEHFRKKFRYTMNLAKFDELFENIDECISKLKVGKPKYVKSLSESLQEMKQFMKRNLLENEYKSIKMAFKKIVNNILDESSKDEVSDLLETSLVENRTDLVTLIIDRMEDMNAFVLLYIPRIYQKCLAKAEKEDVAISLIDQQRKHHGEKEDKVVKVTNKILVNVHNFISDLLGDTHFELYKLIPKTDGTSKPEEIELTYADYPFHHLFVWAIMVNWKEMAMIFWKHDTDNTCSALFASALLNKLAERAHFSSHMDLSTSLRENASYFETLACRVITEMYNRDRDKALKILVTKVGRYNSTPLAIAYSQKLMTFMAITACQAKLNTIWRGDIALYTPSWRIGLAMFFPMLIIQNIGFITIQNGQKTNTISKQIHPEIRYVRKTSRSYLKKRNETEKSNFDTMKKENRQVEKPDRNTTNFCSLMFYYIYLFYRTPIVKFFFYMITYLAFVAIFACFVLTDMYPLSESSPSILEYLTWIWALSLAIEEIRQMLQTDTGSLGKNIRLWAKDVWNIFDVVMYLLFLMSVLLRCLLNSEQFYFARLTYAITLSMFILRSMHFFFVTRYIGPKVIMIGRMLEDLAFFIALFVLFVFSFGIMYQAVLFPNSVLSPWELFKDIVYLPYWQLYGELNLDRIEGAEPSECTNDPHLYSNGSMDRCAQTNQFNSPLLAVYLILTNILLVNILIAMFSHTFQKVQDNSEIIWKFHMYALVYEYYDRPMFPIPIVIHLCRIVVFCYDKIQDYRLRNCKERKTMYASAFILKYDKEEIEKLRIVENLAVQTFLNGPYRAKSRYIARNMMTDERDMNKETDATPAQHDIEVLQEEMHRMRESMINEMQNLRLRQPILIVEVPKQ
ncbi:transient receptor potential cation channel subfamily M member 2-like isoform X1 [Mytilus californianus]|uniref:transient receptor potential cation channel subfamily M member 2-like isoform X1 n=2 Tax=Mytilus californianus TaxID=6549 RepID=UPI002246B919|nr:transient receptor potential cation channel subfamily M member 2-like isoform X1 [Mytilus californianus]XP_052078597.1 transient receptor potential cation channel subfamily M member 2-like isoform X1 [Mytilus californianus]XP_052078598.1 transient receptor potential cation channel subfamily M member 2-like isoform X1 [Mytilus californianus]